MGDVLTVLFQGMLILAVAVSVALMLREMLEDSDD